MMEHECPRCGMLCACPDGEEMDEWCVHYCDDDEDDDDEDGPL